jgi:hypothetical protein
MLRHPSYTGLLLVFAGVGLMWGNWLSAVAAVVLVLIALVHRLRIEERAPDCRIERPLPRVCSKPRPAYPLCLVTPGYLVRCFLVEEAHSRGKSALISQAVPGADRYRRPATVRDDFPAGGLKVRLRRHIVSASRGLAWLRPRPRLEGTSPGMNR